MKWINAKTHPPRNANEVLISDGESYAVAWYNLSDGTWRASADLLEAENHDGRCHISLDCYEVFWWTEIEEPPKEGE